MLHLTRALLAAAITFSIAVTLYVGGVFFSMWRVFGMPPGDAFQVGTAIIPRMVGTVGLLLMLIPVPFMLIQLWAPARGWLSRPWAAAIAGGLCGAAVSPAWMWGCFALAGPVETDGFVIMYNPLPSFWDNAPEAFLFMAVAGAVTGGVYAFLHAFFVQRAVGRKAWLASMEEEEEA